MYGIGWCPCNRILQGNELYLSPSWPALFEQHVLVADDGELFMNLSEYARLCAAIPKLGRSCPASTNFATNTKCHALTRAGKQCTCNANHDVPGGLKLCGNHFIHQENLKTVQHDLVLRGRFAEARAEELEPEQPDFPAGLYQHLGEYVAEADAILPWHDKINQMARQYSEFSTAASKIMPPTMFVSDPTLGTTGWDIKVACAFLVFLRHKAGHTNTHNVRKVPTLKNNWSQVRAGPHIPNNTRDSSNGAA